MAHGLGLMAHGGAVAAVLSGLAFYTISGIWYSKPAFEKAGYTYPKTWADMLTLCEQIKKEGKASKAELTHMPRNLARLSGAAGAPRVWRSLDEVADNA